MSVEVNNESEVDIDETLYLRLASYVLAALNVHADTDMSVIFVGLSDMEQLHKEWMNEPGATDVLSFPMDELRPGRNDAVTPAGLLGDVVICPAVAKEQAHAAGHSIEAEMLMLLTHGMLHLLGFDHATPLEEAEMFGLQRELLTAFHKDLESA